VEDSVDVRRDKGQDPGAPPRASGTLNAQNRTVFRRSQALRRQVSDEALDAAVNSGELASETEPFAPLEAAPGDSGIAPASAGAEPAHLVPEPAPPLEPSSALAATERAERTSADAKQPAADATRPAAEVAMPAADAAKPVAEAAKPTAVIAKPAAEAVKPASVVAKPAVEFTKLPAVVTKPAAELAKPAADAARPAADSPVGPDFDLLARNIGLLVGEGTKALTAALGPIDSNEARSRLADSVTNVMQSFGRVAEYWLADPSRSLEAQKSLQNNFMSLWAHTLRRMSGAEDAPVVPYDATDKRFAAPQWRESPLFDFLRQAHAISSRWAEDLVTKAETADPHARAKARFYVRQISSALSPANFVMTNPELLHETLTTNAANLVRGAELLTEDIEAGRGTLKIRQSDSSKFELGINMAVTPGKVIFRNELIELIQYAPATETVYKRPLLVVPPWINKFYILDLNREKSLVRFMVEQGLTVFTISWVNPDERLRHKTFEDYMREGIFAALAVIREATGEEDVAAMGYCVGGTLLAITLAYMARLGDRRISSATFLATQTDFSEAGDLKVFVDEDQVRALEESMAAKGYLDGSKMATAFNMLRPNDLIWSFIVNNYVRGKEPMAFDLLTWNSDQTRMTEANHSFYLRNCYLDNNLTKGKMEIGGQRLDLSQVTIPVYNLATREDHIAPAKSVFLGSKFFGGDMRYVLAGSGHIAGVVNPPDKEKYQYWTGPRPHGEFAEWLKEATQTKGSWWPDWMRWLSAQAPEKVAARPPGGDKLQPICDAPGEYVRVTS
jgi:polyhydroxyalkanoate synthase subunit PhaC